MAPRTPWAGHRVRPPRLRAERQPSGHAGSSQIRRGIVGALLLGLPKEPKPPTYRRPNQENAA
ncbi:hypothetical protein [Streptomyces inhibens]|uniref:hypothetical protein n=1 Tax=Streptomyces inhibens TaxID=2293571 RepID=UPI001EE6D3B9|nr:hypothetical protein [Streptomyces inhibens]UKY48245.1 hypothetical protein KI385_05135 [Streptomyces inhibens]